MSVIVSSASKKGRKQKGGQNCLLTLLNVYKTIGDTFMILQFKTLKSFFTIICVVKQRITTWRRGVEKKREKP